MHIPLRLRRLCAPLLTGLSLVSLLAGGGTAAAAQFPERPVTIVVPFPAGGTPDILARVLGESLGKRLGQPVVVDNRAGAGGNIGAQLVARSKPDGYTLLMCAFGCSVAPLIYKPAPYELKKDFAPVALLATVPSVLVVHPKVPATSVAELLAYARTHPGKLNSASSGIGSSAHLATELLKAQANINVTHIPYKGAGQVAADLLGGQVDMYFDNLPASLASIKSGKLRALAVASQKRSPSVPDVPTFAEAGVPDFVITPWFGVLAPAGTPEPVLQRVNQAINEALKEPAVSDRMLQLGIHGAGGSRAALATFVEAETLKWKAVVDKNGIRAE